MTVEQLITKLQELNPHDEVIIEINHDLSVPLKEESIVEDIVTPDYRLTTEDDVNSRRVITIRA
tara:strand:- start:263 stop:454 length:192 start_codon:yes stop_codon:yes gene_type:complete